MTDRITAERAQGLLDRATQGTRVQFHGAYCEEAKETPFTEWDSSHEMSVIRPDGSRYRLAEYRHAADAALSQAAPDLARALIASEAARKRAEDRLAKAVEALRDRERESAMQALAAMGQAQEAYEAQLKAEAKLAAAEAREAALREAVDSIARNTCCDGCQEAAAVAHAALAASKEAQG